LFLGLELIYGLIILQRIDERLEILSVAIERGISIIDVLNQLLREVEIKWSGEIHV